MSRCNDSLPMARRPGSVLLSLSVLIAPLALAREPLPASPLQQAVAVCAGRESGASCPLHDHGRSFTGRCRHLPGGTIACVPQPSPLGAPGAGLEACEGQQEGAACGIEGPRGEPLAGVCRSGPSGEAPACVPRNPRAAGGR